MYTDDFLKANQLRIGNIVLDKVEPRKVDVAITDSVVKSENARLRTMPLTSTMVDFGYLKED